MRKPWRRSASRPTKNGGGRTETTRAAEQARLKSERKTAAEKARLEQERKAAAEQARLEKEGKAAEQERVAKRRKAAAAAGLERERQEIAAREVLDDLASSEEPKGSAVKQILLGALASIGLVIGIYMFNRPSKPPEPAPVSHAKVIDIKPTARAGEPPANDGQVGALGGLVNGAATNDASAPKSVTANGNPNGDHQ